MKCCQINKILVCDLLILLLEFLDLQIRFEKLYLTVLEVHILM